MLKLTVRQGKTFSASTLIAGWPGMGNVALGSVRYIRHKLRAMPIGKIDISELAAPDSVAVEQGIASLEPAAAQLLYLLPDQGLLFFEGETQLGGTGGVLLIETLLDFCQQAGVRRIYTGASFPMPMSYKDKSSIYAVATSKQVLGELLRYGVQPMEGGHISGLNGLILGFAAQRNIEAACLLATMPVYAVSLPNPKAFHAVVSTLSGILGLPVDMSDLEAQMAETDERLAAIEAKLGELAGSEETQEEEPPPGPPEAREQPPEQVIRKIEQLFEEAKHDRQKAYLLKQELDRWDLYKQYEDRFLDLFKHSQ